ncbi:hypothetical protein [Xanthomonas theicola]|nr:hypothetical protein [Xanthomonas theicola]
MAGIIGQSRAVARAGPAQESAALDGTRGGVVPARSRPTAAPGP